MKEKRKAGRDESQRKVEDLTCSRREGKVYGHRSSR
jgi:hypothetical protein